ncbi:MAG: AAA family ATPase, partial [Anaerolineae bacterium]|nr:AAA family ATPase [Anaerolineae bacterium]
QDIIATGKSILFLGKPGVGKTTMLREAARVLAESRRVVIVDTSNEIGGDGDVPHPAIGKARRMQVPTPNLQHEVMIEAVENHNPEVVVIDEIGRELEAQAARTIAERGVQLIGTAHGITLDNLLLNPILSDLVGGIESVTLSDEEARRRGTQKTVLERRAPPTFDVLIELQDRNSMIVHHDVMVSVDMLLRGKPFQPEVRSRTQSGEIFIHKAPPPESNVSAPRERPGGNLSANPAVSRRGREEDLHEPVSSHEIGSNGNGMSDFRTQVKIRNPESLKQIRVYPYGIARNRLIETGRRFRVPVQVVDTVEEADVMVTLKNFYRRRPRLVLDAEGRGMPIYVLRSNTVTQMENFLIDLYNLEVDTSGNAQMLRAMQEASEAIQRVLNGEDSVDISPQNATVRRQQHELTRRYNLMSHSLGQEPERHLRIFRG